MIGRVRPHAKIVVEGVVDMKLNGTADILYSADAISQALSSTDGSFQRLSWREIPVPGALGRASRVLSCGRASAG